MADRKAFRASILHCLDDPGEKNESAAVEYFADGLLLVKDGHVVALGEAKTLMPIAPPVVDATFVSSSIVTFLSQLDRRAFYGAERAVNTAVTGIWPQYLATANTVVKKLTGVCRHALARFVSAMRTGNY